MVNDIIRYWKTICLNYEHKRNNPNLSKTQKNKNHLRNLKLKFSRLLTCFSTVIPLCETTYSKPDQIIKLVRMPPLQRLKRVVGNDTKKKKILEGIIGDYVWFLKKTASKDILRWIGERDNRGEAFRRAREFGKRIFLLLEECSRGSDTLRYIVT